MKRVVLTSLLFSIIYVFSFPLFAQQNFSQGERVIMKECGNYAIAPANNQTLPNAREKKQLIEQVGATEFNQLIKTWYVSQWPASIKQKFMDECEQLNFRKSVVMYKIAVLTDEEGYQTAVVRIPAKENKAWIPASSFNGNLYLQLPDNDLLSWKEYSYNGNENSGGGHGLIRYEEAADTEAYVYFPKAGDKLIYKVTSEDGNAYDFIISIHKFIPFNLDDFESAEYPAAFFWQINKSADKSGEVFINKKAITSATDYVNYFRNGEIKTLINQSSVFLSSKNWYEPISSEDRSTTMNMTGTEEKYYKNTENFEYLKVKVKEKMYRLPVYRYNNAKDGTGSYSVYVQDNAGCPLILKMKLNFEIELKEIIPAG
jgi:hypothetical protein